MAYVETVLGPVDPDALGVTLMHEHTLFDGYPWPPPAGRTIPWTYTYDSIVADEALLIEELGRFRAAGGGSLVDLTTIGIGRNPAGMRRLAAATGLHLVMGCGWYREPVYPPGLTDRPVDELAAVLIGELRTGVEGGIRPGVIGEIGTERGAITPAQARVFRAAALASIETGAAILTHTTNRGELALAQVDLLTDAGVPPERIVIGHVGSARRDADDLLALVDRGVTVSVDHIGRSSLAGIQPEAQKARNVAAVVRAGHASRVVLSMDVCSQSQLAWFGGHGYDHLLRAFVPLLREVVVDAAELETMLVANPRRILAIDRDRP